MILEYTFKFISAAIEESYASFAEITLEFRPSEIPQVIKDRD